MRAGPMADPILVTGFLGAGKSTLVSHLREILGVVAEEMDGLSDPATCQPAPMICAADAVNIARWLDDPLCAPLVRQQITCAGLVVLLRSDLVDPTTAQETLAALTKEPVVTTPFGVVTAHTLSNLVPRPRSEQVGDLTSDFAEWSYVGSAILQSGLLETVLERRPKGIYRLSGVVRTPEGGLEVDTVGRSRQTKLVERPADTELRARGPKTLFNPTDMDIRFAEAVSDSISQSGAFSYR